MAFSPVRPAPCLLPILAGLAFLLPSVRAADSALLPNPGFEEGLEGWTASAEDGAQGFSKAAADAAHTGKLGLHVSQPGTGKTTGASLDSRPFPVQPGESYELEFWTRCQEESGVGVFLQFYDARHQLLTQPPRAIVQVVPFKSEWTQYRLKGTAPDGAATANVWVHGWSNAKCNADFDDFVLTKVALDPSAARVPVERVRAVAALLDAAPRGVCPPISDRAAWERAAKRPGWRATMIANAERLLPEMQGPLTDDQSHADKPGVGAEQRRYGLVVLTVAECLENKGRFLPAIEKDIRALASERTWVGPMHDKKLLNFNGSVTEIDLISSMTVWNLATADWLLGERLSPEARRSIRAEADRRVFEPFLAQARGQAKPEWWSASAFNWNPVVHSGIVGAATAMIEPVERRAEIIAYAEQNVRAYLTGFKSDGSTPEGIGYWNYGFGHYALMAETLLSATHGGINIYGDERVRLVAQTSRRLEIVPHVYPVFADCLLGDRPAKWLLNLLDHRYGFGWKIPPDEWGISSQFGASLYAVAMMAFFDPATPVVSPGKKADAAGGRLRDWLPAGGVYVGRVPAAGATDPARMGLALKTGNNNEPHCHLDVGSYVVAFDREAMLLDPGAPVYTMQTFSERRWENPLLNSHGHAVPLVAGQGQAFGSEHLGTFVQNDFTDALDTLGLDLMRAYAVPALKKLTRTFTLDRARGGAVTITDRVEYQSPQTFGTALVTLGKVREVRPGVLQVSWRHRTMEVTVDTGGQPFALTDEVIQEELKNSPYKARRMGIDLKNPVASATVTLRIRPVEPAEPDPAAVDAKALESLRPDLAAAVTVNAADFSRQAGGNVVPTAVAGSAGGALRNWKGTGHALTWKLRVPAAGTYGVQVRHCADLADDAACALQVDGAPVAGPDFLLAPTGGWSLEENDWATSWLARGGRPATVALTAGEHELTLVSRGVGTTLDWVRLVPLRPQG